MTVTPGAPRLAPVGRRVAAFTVDAAVVTSVAVLVLTLTDEVLYAALAFGELVVAMCVWEARSGTTVGNALCSVRTARTDGRHAPGIRRVLVRGLVVAAGALVAVVGQWVVVASAAWDRGPLRQGWHDAVAGTTMVDVSRRAPERATGRSGRATRGEMTTAPASAQAAGTPAVAATRRQRRDAPTPPPVFGAPAARPAPAALGAPAPRPDVAPAPPISAVPSAPAPAGYLLSFDNGQSFLVRGSGLVGRKPQSAPGERHDDLLAVTDDDRSVSKTHLEFGVDVQGFWVCDRGSTNGSAVLAAHGDPVDVLPGTRVHVPAGASVRVGQRQFTATRVSR